MDNLPIPLGFADRLYELRQDIELARRRLAPSSAFSQGAPVEHTSTCERRPHRTILHQRRGQGMKKQQKQ
jgi:hypothetical protein